MRNRGLWTIVALILCGLGFSVVLTLAQRELNGPPPLLLSSAQQERAEHWKSVLNDYFETSSRPFNTSVNQDLESLKNRLGGEYSLTKEQVDRIRWFHEQLGATVARIIAQQDDGRTNYGPYPVLNLRTDSDTQKAEIELSLDGKKITAISGPTPVDNPNGTG